MYLRHMFSVTPASLAEKLRNIGPVCAQHLLEAGIDSREQLQQLGAMEAFLRIYAHNKITPHAAYLYALEGAIRDCDWRDIPQGQKEVFKQFTASLRRDQKG